jgi:hypothetical protein
MTRAKGAKFGLIKCGLPAQNTAGKRYAEPNTEDKEKERGAADTKKQRAGRTERLEKQHADHKEDSRTHKVAERLQRQRVEKEEEKA